MVRAGKSLSPTVAGGGGRGRPGALSAVWRIAPPLTVTKDAIDRGLAIMDGAITSVPAEGRA
ncbi:MAG: hypothetical protein L6R19_07560 [Alphaproteobacteria bacterium]|nr:hypothetical protein [Alphaproteobacteria bacterium]